MLRTFNFFFSPFCNPNKEVSCSNGNDINHNILLMDIENNIIYRNSKEITSIPITVTYSILYHFLYIYRHFARKLNFILLLYI